MKKEKEHKVIVYSTDWCPWCTKAKEWLDAHKIRYEVRDPEKNPKYADELVQKSSQSGIPVIDIDGHIIVGFNESEMLKHLAL